jgi:hypothetical protein
MSFEMPGSLQRWRGGVLRAVVLWAFCGCSAAPAPASPGSAGTAGGAGAAAGGGAGAASAGCGPSVTLDAGASDGQDEAAAACEACELSADPSVIPSCDPAFLTATKDPAGVPVGWGLATLATEAQRRAAAALLRCLDANACAANASNTGPGDNAALGCFCGSGVAPVDCIAGQGVHGPCLQEYEAAAVTTTDGPSVCASLSAFSAFVSTATAGSSGPISLAGNIKRCAIDAQCAACDAL